MFQDVLFSHDALPPGSTRAVRQALGVETSGALSQNNTFSRSCLCRLLYHGEENSLSTL